MAAGGDGVGGGCFGRGTAYIKSPRREEGVFQTIEPPFRRAQRGSLLALIGFVGLCLLVSFANGAVTAASVGGWYRSLVRPPLTPPNWIFAPVWTVLYVTIGVAAWLVWRRVDIGMHRKRAALRVWGWQLLLNSSWPAIFFGAHRPGFGMAAILLLLGSILFTMRAFWPLQRGASVLLVPYALWVGFASYLNAGFCWFNGP